MEKILVRLLTIATLISVIFLYLIIVSDKPVNNVSSTILQKVNPKSSNIIFFSDSLHINFVIYKVKLNGDILSIKGSDETNFSFNITSLSSYVGYHHTTSGNPVKAAQILLNKYNAKSQNGNLIEIDSKLGLNTHSMLVLFQSKNSLTVDGTIGPNTWRKLCSFL